MRCCISDTNECSTAQHVCHANGNCTNVKGSFNCNCNRGFQGNGSFCEGVLE